MPAASLAPSDQPLDVIGTRPWTGLQREVNTRVDFARTLPTSVTTARPCRAADLEQHPEHGPGMGTEYASLRVRNVSSTPCLVSGAPRLAMLDEHGVVWHSTGTVRANNGEAVGPMVLVPGSWAVDAPLALGSSCGGYGRTVALRLTMPDGGGSTTVPWVVGTRGPDRCADDGPQPSPAPHPGDFDLTPFRPVGPDATVSAMEARDRRIQLLVPDTAPRGRLLKYRVRISARPVTGVGLWDPPDCPLFQQTLLRTGPAYVLNCPEAPFLEDGQALDFAMEVPVPADAPLGPTSLSWHLVEPEEAPLTTTVTVTR